MNLIGFIINNMNKRNKKGRFIKGYTYRNKKLFWEKEWLINEYIIKKKSTKEIAVEQNCHRNNILFWLNKHNISVRNVSQSRKVKHWGLSGVDNPMWNKKGELNHNWKGGITPERQFFYISQEWKNVCSLIWKRDNATCQRCGVKKNTDIPFHIHHIKSFSDKELRADKDNLILVCEICHHWIHSKSNIEGEFLK
jgi:5-methylcytosine-specific restriction endonuclease McrA